MFRGRRFDPRLLQSVGWDYKPKSHLHMTRAVGGTLNPNQPTNKIVFDHLKFSFKAVNAVLMCKIGIKYQKASRTVCAYGHIFRKRSGCALIGACALIRTNTVDFSCAKTKTQISCAVTAQLISVFVFALQKGHASFS